MLVLYITMSNYSLINYYHDKQNNIILKLYDNDTNTIIKTKKTNEFYFFINEKDYEIAKNTLQNITYINKFTKMSSDINFIYSISGKYIKVLYSSATDIYIYDVQNTIRQALDKSKITHYELDLMPGDNFILEKDIPISTKYRILYLDIETRDDTGDIEIGRDRILSICCVDNTGKEFIFCDDDEQVILNNYVNLLNEYDILVGWNANKFDFPYIKERLKKYNIYYTSKNHIYIDLMQVFMDSFAVKTRIGKKYLTSYSLDNICKSFLNMSKIKIEESDEGYGGRLWNLFNTNRDKLIKYNLQDSKLLKLLDEEFSLIDNEIILAQLVKAPLSKTRSLISMIDFLFIREARKRGMHLLSKPQNVEKATYPGGYVYEHAPGMFENVNIFDFASLYPSIFRTFNISPDTLLAKEEENCIKLPNGKFFTQKFRGLIPSILDELTELRLKLKKEQQELKAKGLDEEVIKMDFKQTSVKVLILSIYGTSGSAYFRGFNIDVASSITEMGQHLLKAIIFNLNQSGYLVVGGDTDSFFVQIHNPEHKSIVEKIIANTIDTEVSLTGVTKNLYLRTEHEKILSKFIVIAKKKYAGRCIYDNKECDYIYSKGLELVQASQLKLTKELLSKVLDNILYSKDKKLIINIVNEYRNKILRKKIDDVNDIAIIKKVGKMPDGYKSLPAHVALAVERSKQGEKFYTSQKVPFIVLSNNPLKIIHINDYKGDYDVKYYWTNQIYPPTFRLLEVVYPKDNWNNYANADIYQKKLCDF
jgi:DNA polymerase, archaea type